MIENKERRIYQAIGVVEGILAIDGKSSTLTIGETVFPAIVTQQPRKKHQPGQIQRFRVYPGLRQGKSTFKVISIVDSSPTPFTLKGCWELYLDEAFLVIYRNDVYLPGDRQLRSLISVEWKDAPPTDRQFWELEAELQGDKLIVLKAEGPFKPPPRAEKYLPPVKAPALSQAIAAEKPALDVTEKPTAKVKTAPEPQVPTTATPLTIQEIRAMATPAKISLTCKLNQLPAHRELPDKQIEFFLNDGSDRIFTVRMKPKLFKKLTDHGFAQWVAAISGELGPTTQTGFELLNPALQVFEKKASADAPAGQKKASAPGAVECC